MNDEVPTVLIDRLENLKDYALIDVRGEDEFFGELGHIEGAELVILGPALENFLQKTDKNQKLIFICRSGVRSANATLMAMNAGFNNVFNMAGGMIEWNRKGLPIV